MDAQCAACKHAEVCRYMGKVELNKETCTKKSEIVERETAKKVRLVGDVTKLDLNGKCDRCGAVLNMGDHYCGICGRKLTER